MGYPEASNNTTTASGAKARQSCTDGTEVRLNPFLASALNGGFPEDSRSGYFFSRKSTHPSCRKLHGLQNRSGRFGEQNNPWPAKSRNPQFVARHLLTLTNLSSSAHSVL